MNYRHVFHAGNFADVLKHVVLIILIKTMQKKDKPLFYLDTHAGIGKYDLASESAQKTREYENGIGRIYSACDSSFCPQGIATYLKIVRAINIDFKPKKTNHVDSFLQKEKHKNLELRFYPGSPKIVQYLLRPQDMMNLTELHKEDIVTLKEEFIGVKRIAIHHLCGYQALKAFLPPQCGRGLILIDPAYEDKNEFDAVIIGMEVALKRFPSGIYAIWYPIKDVLVVEKFYRKLKSLCPKNIVVAEFALNLNDKKVDKKAEQQDTANSLVNCGIAIINAPWLFYEKLKREIKWLGCKMGCGEPCKNKVFWLLEERG